jgi:hypothetical protein
LTMGLLASTCTPKRSVLLDMLRMKAGERGGELLTMRRLLQQITSMRRLSDREPIGL